MLRKYFWIPLVLVLLGVGGFLTFGRSREVPAIEVTAVKSVTGEFVRESKASGNVEARVYALNFPRPGRVARVLVQEGASVRSGALLAELDTADDSSKLISARENLATVQVRLQTGSSEADANRAKAVSGLNAARSKLELAKKLLARHLGKRLTMQRGLSQTSNLNCGCWQRRPQVLRAISRHNWLPEIRKSAASSGGLLRRNCGHQWMARSPKLII
jgi:multidrug efflux pump subunit AcrA (membrane-fusion protein)